jgi:hypothetical protein
MLLCGGYFIKVQKETLALKFLKKRSKEHHLEEFKLKIAL